jgi:NAD(P)-dependent dehydrogenase (short-subunit alcohol dehydrogenase family)
MAEAAMSNGKSCIFITGAASGIGRATARLFASKGWFVGAFDVDEAGLGKLREELGETNCFTRRLDVTDKADYDAAVEAFGRATGGRLDLLFNNAGIGRSGFFEDVPFEETLRVVNVNLVGVLNGIHAALPLLRQTKNSLCFSTSSSSATHGIPGIAVYSATKFAVKGLTEALSIEFERHGVRVADTLPGLIDTGILDSTPDYTRGRPADRDIRDTAAKKGMFRLMPPEAVAEAVWEAYSVGGRLHYYVPPEIGRIDKLKVFAPMFVRKQISKIIDRMIEQSQG